jgi:hypothetical protein
VFLPVIELEFLSKQIHKNTLAVGLEIYYAKSSIAKYTIALLTLQRWKICSLKIGNHLSISKLTSRVVEAD